MQNATYTIKIKDLLAVPDERKRWILVKKALAANVGQESTRAIEFGYVDLAHASDRLRLMMDEQSETMTLPAGLEPVDPSDNDSSTRALLIPWAREVAVKPTMRIASRKGKVKPAPEAAVEDAKSEPVAAVPAPVETPPVAEPVVEATEVVAEQPVAGSAETVDAVEQDVVEETSAAEIEEEEPVSYPFVQGKAPVVEEAAGQDDRVAADAAEGETQFIADFLQQVDVEERAESVTAEPTPAEAVAEADVQIPEAVETPVPDSPELESVMDEDVGEGVSGTETRLETVAEAVAEDTVSVAGDSYSVDIEALLAVSDQRVRRVLARKAAAFILKRRYTSSIGKSVREAGSIEALLRRAGPTLSIPAGYEPVDSTDKGEAPVSLIAFAHGGEAVATVESPIPRPPAKRRGRPPRVKEAPVEAVVEAPVEPVAAKVDAPAPAPHPRARQPRKKDSAPQGLSFAGAVSAAVTEAIAPYLDEEGRFRDGKEGLAAIEYFARALEAEAALVRLAAFGRGKED